MIVEIMLVIFIWTMLSIVWFLLSMGNKFGENKWYDYVLSPPVLVIAYLTGLISRLFNK